MKGLLLTCLFVFGVAGVLSPSLSFAATASCAKQQIKAEKTCLKKPGKSSCRQATATLNKCLKNAAKQTPPQEICIQLYAPVCGQNADGSLSTYSNSCYAALSQAAVLFDGECLK